jgi:serine/threonine protein kinase
MTTTVDGLAEGTRVAGRYRIIRKLGAGGMGAVYEAVQEAISRKVALKVLLPAYAENPEAVARFHREAQAAASLGHPNIVSVTDFGADNGVVFLVMELLVGESLASAIERGPSLAPGRAAWIASQVLSALSVAHQAGIVHRDMKPDNVFLTEVSGMNDVVKLLDFGIARFTEQSKDSKLTHTGAVLGTPMYMSPEQARGRAVDHRTDLYSVGAILYEMLTGRLPFAAENVHALLFAILEDTPTPISSLRSDVSPGLVAVVERAMAKDASARFQTAEEFRAALDPYVDRSAPRTTGVHLAPTRESPMVTAPTMAAVVNTGPLAAQNATGPTPTPDPYAAAPLPVPSPQQPSPQQHPPTQPVPTGALASAAPLAIGTSAPASRPTWLPWVGASVIALVGVATGIALKGSASREPPAVPTSSIDDAVRAAIARLDAATPNANVAEQRPATQPDAALVAAPATNHPTGATARTTAQATGGRPSRSSGARSGGVTAGSVSAPPAEDPAIGARRRAPSPRGDVVFGRHSPRGTPR